MKKCFFLLLLIPLLSIAQTEKISFTKKLTYISEYRGDLININLYFSKNGIYLEGFKEKGDILIKDQLINPININIDNRALFSDDYYYPRLDSLPTYQFEKLDEKDNISGYECTYYTVTGNENDYSYNNMKWCIAEDSSIDVLSQINNNKKDKVIGYPIALSYYNNFIFLKSIKNYSNSISIDYKGELAKAREKIKKYQEIYVEDVSASDSTAVPVDSAATTIDYNETKYKSEYKNINQNKEKTYLSFKELDKESAYWKGIPEYCSELKDKLPDFKNKELKKHAKNYAEQVCEIYFYISESYYGNQKNIIDQIRYEEDYFRNNRNNFSKKDQKLLDKFLNKLD